MTDTGSMDDDFGFGNTLQSKAPVATGDEPVEPTAAPRRPLSGRSAWLVVGGLVAAALAVGVFMVLRAGGEAVVEGEGAALDQVGAARDTQAQVALQQAQSDAMQLYAEAGTPSYTAADATALTKMDGAYTFTDGPSTGPTVVSVSATSTEWGAAVLSGSGTCLWVHLDAGGGSSTGEGTPCTGRAAMGA